MVGRRRRLRPTLLAVATQLRAALKDRWYHIDAAEVGNRQFVLADPDR